MISHVPNKQLHRMVYRLSIQRITKCILIGIFLLLLALPKPSYSFSVEIIGAGLIGEPIHDGITRNAIRNVDSDISPRFIDSVIAGNVNVDTAMTSGLIGVATNPSGGLLIHKFVSALHVNSATATNGQFDNSHRFINKMYTLAVQHAKSSNETNATPNPRFLASEADEITSSENLRLIADMRMKGLVLGLILVPNIGQAITQNPDPHSQVGRELLRILEQLEGVERTARLDNLLLELRGYAARQYLGHAFHTLQDFFAHSNVVELLYGKNGPPCESNMRNARALCDWQITAPQPQRFSGFADLFLQKFRDRPTIDSNNLSNMLGDELFERLQTGFVERTVRNIATGQAMKEEYCGTPAFDSGGFDYCHWRKGNVTPGLNKDKGCDGRCDEKSHENHRYAYNLAKLATEILFEQFLLNTGHNRPLPSMTVRRNRNETISVTEAAGQATVDFELSQDAPYAITFYVNLSSGQSTGEVAGGSGGPLCYENTDFITTRQRVVINEGDAGVSIRLPICDDRGIEGVESVSLLVTRPRMVRYRERGPLTVLINDNDVEPAPTFGNKVLNAEQLQKIKPAKTRNSNNANLSCSVQKCPKGRLPFKNKRGDCICR